MFDAEQTRGGCDSPVPSPVQTSFQFEPGEADAQRSDEIHPTTPWVASSALSLEAKKNQILPPGLTPSADLAFPPLLQLKQHLS